MRSGGTIVQSFLQNWEYITGSVSLQRLSPTACRSATFMLSIMWLGGGCVFPEQHWPRKLWTGQFRWTDQIGNMEQVLFEEVFRQPYCRTKAVRSH